MLCRERDPAASSPGGLSELGRGPNKGTEALDGIEQAPRGRFEQIVFGFDSLLRRCHSIIEYTSDPRCILRIKLGRLEADVLLSDGTHGRAGDRIIDLHLWSEQIPRMPKAGASIAWALHMSACFRFSLEELARYLACRADLDDVGLVRCNMAFGGPERNAQMVRLISRYGFEPVPPATAVTLAERARLCGENILISLMVFARNSSALRPDTLRRCRTQVFLSRRALERRYAAGGLDRANQARPLPHPPPELAADLLANGAAEKIKRARPDARDQVMRAVQRPAPAGASVHDRARRAG